MSPLHHFGQNVYKKMNKWGFLLIKCTTLEKSSYTWPHCKNEMGSKGKITEKIAQPFRNPFDYTDQSHKRSTCMVVIQLNSDVNCGDNFDTVQ